MRIVNSLSKALIVPACLALGACSCEPMVKAPAAPAPAPAPVLMPVPVAKPAPVVPKPAPVVVPALKPAPQYVISDIYFNVNESLVGTEVETQMKNNVEWLAANPGKVLVLEGHTDERGSYAYNMALGKKRAQQAKEFMVSLGADPNRLEVVSKGESEPLDPASSEAAWAKNRRVHVVVK